jgi:hypothetical protein
MLLFPSDADFFSDGHMPAGGIWLDEDMLATRYNAEIGEYYFEYRASLIYPKDDG